MSNSDLFVQPISDALSSWSIDVVVSGSIGAVESVRYVRALRRLGAEVQVWLSGGASQFVTETALAWASAKPVITSFSGEASHIGLRDACIVAPASASIISKISHGISDTPTSALLASYLGQKKPVLLAPNMHDSLYNSPFFTENLTRLQKYCHILHARLEEAKHKFPDPRDLADETAHTLNQQRSPKPHTLISMGTTRGYIDEVRYISNYSTGGLGTKISEELYRQGFPTTVVCGPCPIKPRLATKLITVETNEDLAEACQRTLNGPAELAILAASVLDFIPMNTRSGKISSAEQLTVEFVQTKKIIADLHPRSGIKVGFKLETELDETKAKSIAERYFAKYQLSHMVLNALSEVDETRHKAFIACGGKPNQLDIIQVETKQGIAQVISRLLSMSPQLKRACSKTS